MKLHPMWNTSRRCGSRDQRHGLLVARHGCVDIFKLLRHAAEKFRQVATVRVEMHKKLTVKQICIARQLKRKIEIVNISKSFEPHPRQQFNHIAWNESQSINE